MPPRNRHNISFLRDNLLAAEEEAGLALDDAEEFFLVGVEMERRGEEGGFPVRWHSMRHKVDVVCFVERL